MQSTNVLSLTEGVNAWLANTHQPRILHVFDPACNLINEHNEVLSLVTRQIGNGPFNVVIDTDVSFPDYVDAESAISILSDRLHLGELTINTGNAELWNPCPDWETLRARRDKIPDSLRHLEIVLPATTLQIPNFQSLVSALCSAIVNSDISSAASAATKMAGLGSGLTPAGDDVIIGALYAACIIHPADLAKSLAAEIANAAAPRTTSLSAAWLRSAGRGEIGILWHQFFDELHAEPVSNSASLTDLLEAANAILNVGETSGADALSGFIHTFMAYTEKVGA